MSLPSVENLVLLHLITGWAALTLGVLTGSLLGLFFHRVDWLGGYSSQPRRLARLGHIAFFGMAILNFSLAMTMFMVAEVNTYVVFGSYGLLIATVTMPLSCFYAMVRGINRVFFTVPVFGSLVLVVSVLGMLLTVSMRR